MRVGTLAVLVLGIVSTGEAQSSTRKSVCRRAYYPTGAITCDTETKAKDAEPLASATTGFLEEWARAAAARRPPEAKGPAPVADPAVAARERERDRKRFESYALRARDVLDSALVRLDIGWTPADSFWAAGSRVLLDLHDVNAEASTAAMWDAVTPLVREWELKSLEFSRRFRAAFAQVADSLGLAGEAREAANRRGRDAAFTYFKMDLDISPALIKITVRRAVLAGLSR